MPLPGKSASRKLASLNFNFDNCREQPLTNEVCECEAIVETRVLPSRRAPPPWMQTWNPSGYMSAEAFVLGPKRCPQLRLLVRQDKQVKA